MSGVLAVLFVTGWVLAILFAIAAYLFSKTADEAIGLARDYERKFDALREGRTT